MKARLGIPAALFFLLLVTNPASANVSNDQVQSQHIREADGTSGQNTNSGAGVKTGHIQNSAVTSEKIQDGQVLNADLATGAVTDAKISGVISATKLPVGTTAGTVAAGNHNHDNLYQKKYANVVVVAKNGGDFTDPIAAIDSITDASGMNPYLVKIMPGVYDMGNRSVLMKPFVDVEGSGENVTTITGGDPYISYKLVVSASHAGLRDLSLKAAGDYQACAIFVQDANPVIVSRVTVNASVSSSGQVAWAILCNGNGTVFLKDVSANAMGPGSMGLMLVSQCSASLENVDVHSEGNAVTVLNSGIDMKNVTVSASWLGFDSNNNSDVNMEGVAITANFATQFTYGTVAKIDHSIIAGSSIAVAAAGGSVYMGSTKVIGPILAPDANYKCIGVYDGNYDPVTCP